jgi:NitT/TauT family transport system permease protein
LPEAKFGGFAVRGPLVVSARLSRVAPNRWDVVAVPLVLGVLAIFAVGAHQMAAPLEVLQKTPVSLDVANLPGYALRTTLRMLAALAASLLFTLVYGALAAKSRRAALILIPILDVLQSVPILGFISFTIVAFLEMFPGSTLGPECAAIFAIFTSQAWNMAFSFYQSLRTVPKDLDEVSRGFHLSAWQRFWRLEVPYAMPGLIWNMMMSMSGGWFFVVASEAISVGNQTYSLPGIGSYVALAITNKNLGAVGWAVLTMLIVIIVYDQLLFRPLVAWAEKFRFEQTVAQIIPKSWVLDLLQRSRFVELALSPAALVLRQARRLRLPAPGLLAMPVQRWLSPKMADGLWYAAITAIGLYGAWRVVDFIRASLGLSDLIQALELGLITLIRVLVLIALASLIWVPVGVWIGLRPKLAEWVQPIAQFLAAFPANLLFPAAVVVIVRFNLNTDIWLSPLMILGTQWYILFNVIAGATAYPNDLKEAAANFDMRGWKWWTKVILPGIFPYYVTGAITASGGSWNASIVTEIVAWGPTTLQAHGLGAYIAQATTAGDYPRIMLGIAVMSGFVILLNRGFWRRLYVLSERRLRFD